MIQKAQVENFLRLNGIPATAPDEEIRSALISASWHEDDVEIALMVLRGQKGSEAPEDVEVIAARQLFHSDARVSPKLLSSLLGVPVHSKEGSVRAVYRKELSYKVMLMRAIVIVLLSLLIGGVFIFFLMYAFDMGIFHTPAELPITE